MDIALSSGSDAKSDEEIDLKDIQVPTYVMNGNGLCSRQIGMKLVVMTWIWICATVNYSMINIYLKYVPGALYLNFSISGISEIAAHVVCSIVFLKFTPRWTFFMGFLFAVIGGTCLLWQNKFSDQAALVASFVLFAKFGSSMAMCACYVSTPFVFPI